MSATMRKNKKADVSMPLTAVPTIILTILVLVVFYLLFDMLLTAKSQAVTDVSDIQDHMKLISLLRTPVEVRGEVMTMGDLIAIAEDDAELEAILKRELYNAIVAAPEGMFGPIRIEYQKEKFVSVGINNPNFQDVVKLWIEKTTLGKGSGAAEFFGEYDTVSSAVVPTLSGSNAVVYLIQFYDKKRNNLKFSDMVQYVKKGDKLYSPEGVVYVYWGSDCPCNADRRGCWSVDGEPCFTLKDKKGKVVCESDENAEEEESSISPVPADAVSCTDYFVPDADFKNGVRPAYLGEIDEEALVTDPEGCDPEDNNSTTACCIVPAPGQTRSFIATDGDYPHSRSVESRIGSCIYHPGLGKKIVYWGSYGFTGTHQENNHYWCDYDACKKVLAGQRKGAYGVVNAGASGVGSAATSAATKVPTPIFTHLFTNEGICYDARSGEEYFITDQFIRDHCYSVSYLLRLTE